jgi:hypothetical protein
MLLYLTCYVYFFSFYNFIFSLVLPLHMWYIQYSSVVGCSLLVSSGKKQLNSIIIIIIIVKYQLSFW